MSTRVNTAYLVAGVRTPFGRYGGALAARAPGRPGRPRAARADRRLPSVDWAAVDDVVLGCANQAGEDNRNVARMAVLLAGLPVDVPGTTVNRLCGSGAGRRGDRGPRGAHRRGRPGDRRRRGEHDPRADGPAQGRHGLVAHRRGVRHDDRLAVRQPGDARAVRHRRDAGDRGDRGRASTGRPGRPGPVRAALPGARGEGDRRGRLAREIEPVPVPQRKGRSPCRSASTSTRAPPRWRRWVALRPLFPDGTVTAGNSSGSTTAPPRCWWPPRRPCAATAWSRSPGSGSAPSPGSPPEVMGIGPVPGDPEGARPRRARHRRPGRDRAERGVRRAGPGRTRALGLPDDAEHVNPNGGAIALGHPLGASGARLALTAALELHDRGARRALATMCIGVGQGIAVLFEAA